MFISIRLRDFLIPFILLSILLLGSACSVRDNNGDQNKVELYDDNGDLISVLSNADQSGRLPLGTEFVFNKDHFFKKDTSGELLLDSQGQKVAKTFLCGMVNLENAGSLSHFFHFENYNLEFACNVQFFFQKNVVEIKLIDPNYPSPAQSSKWPVLMTVLVDHLWKEEKRDTKGRKTKDLAYFKESYYSPASKHSDAPYIRIKFDEGIGHNRMTHPVFAKNPTSVEDVEIEMGQGKRSFIGLTVNGSSLYFGANYNWKTRYNFLEIEPNKEFKMTQFNKFNSKYVYPVFTLGKLVGEQSAKKFYVSKWQLDEKNPIPIVLNNWPNEYKDLAAEVLQEWNDALTKANYPNAKNKAIIEYFKISTHKPKFDFDLRYNSMTWIDDPLLSSRGPLGVAMVNPDINTGEIKWGNVNVYGGRLHNIVNRNLSNVGNDSALNNLNIYAALPPSFSGKDYGKDFYDFISDSLIHNWQGEYNEDYSLGVILSAMASSLSKANLFGLDLSDFQMSGFENFVDSTISSESLSAEQQQLLDDQIAYSASSGQELMNNFFNANMWKNYISSNDWGNYIAEQSGQQFSLLDKTVESQFILNNESSFWLDNLNEAFTLAGKRLNVGSLNKFSQPGMDASAILGISGLTSQKDYLNEIGRIGSQLYPNLISRDASSFSNAAGSELFSAYSQLANLSKSIQSGNEGDVDKLNAQRVQLIQQYPGLKEQSGDNFLGPYLKNVFDTERTVEAYLEQNSIDDTLVDYEPELAKQKLIKEILSHEIGHFMGLGHNFMSHILPLNKSDYPSDIYQELEDRALGKEGVHVSETNSTAIMGYPSMKMVLNARLEDLKPGVQDIQNLTYIYSNMYPELEGDQFVYKPVGMNGIIPDSSAYFPQCGDYEASFGMSPYCSRWSQGYNASTIVMSSIENLVDRVQSSIRASSDVAGSNLWRAEAGLWYSSLFSLTRIRKFYDYMRYTYNDVFSEALDLASKNNNSNYLLSFGDSCSPTGVREKEVSDFWNSNFEKYPELKELCEVNRTALTEITKQIIGADSLEHTERQNDYYRLAVSRSNGLYDASIGSFSELSWYPVQFSALLTMMSSRPYQFSRGYLFPIWQYSDHESFFEYKYLYPKQFADLISENSTNNIGLDINSDDLTLEDIRVRKLILAMGAFNFQWGNDNLQVTNEYSENIRDLIGFNGISLGYLVMEKIEDLNKPNRVVQFDTDFYRFGSRNSVSVTTTYLLETGQVLAKKDESTFIIPLSKVIWVNDSIAVSLGLYTNKRDNSLNELKDYSVASRLTTNVHNFVNQCIGDGEKLGLSHFFTASSITNVSDDSDSDFFDGFIVKPNIAREVTLQNEFFESIETAYNKFYEGNWIKSERLPPTRQSCSLAIKALTTGIVAAGAMNWDWRYVYGLLFSSMKRER